MKPYRLFKGLISCALSIAVIVGVVSIVFLVNSSPALAEPEKEEHELEHENEFCDKLYEKDKIVEQNCVDECDLKKKKNLFDTLLKIQLEEDDLKCEKVRILRGVVSECLV